MKKLFFIAIALFAVALLSACTAPEAVTADASVEQPSEPSQADESFIKINGVDYRSDITELELDEINNLELKRLNEFTNLQKLSITDITVLDAEGATLSAIGELSSLVELIIEQNTDFADAFHDITPLSGLVNLQKLSLNYSESELDISPLGELNRLTELNLGLTSDSAATKADLAPLGKLTRLTKLSLNLAVNSAEVDLAPLDALSALRELDVTFYPPGEDAVMDVDFSALESLTALEKLRIDYYRMDDEVDLLPLARLDNLTELRLGITSLREERVTVSLPELSGLTALDIVDIGSDANHSPTGIINGLSICGAPNLTELLVHDLLLDSLIITDLPNLSNLVLGDSEQKNLDDESDYSLAVIVLALERLPSLEKTDISSVGFVFYNHPQVPALIIQDVPSLASMDVPYTVSTLYLANLPNLSQLSVPENHWLQEVTLHNMPLLPDLEIDDDKLIASVDLANLPLISSLDLTHFENISLNELPDLTELTFDYIYVTEFTAGSLPSLRSLELNGLDIEKYEQLMAALQQSEDLTPEVYFGSIALDGWYDESTTIALNRHFSKLTYRFEEEERDTRNSVYILADGKRVRPENIEGDLYELNVKGVRKLYIESRRPGIDWTPYSEQIVLEDIKLS